MAKPASEYRDMVEMDRVKLYASDPGVTLGWPSASERRRDRARAEVDDPAESRSEDSSAGSRAASGADERREMMAMGDISTCSELGMGCTTDQEVWGGRRRGKSGDGAEIQ